MFTGLIERTGRIVAMTNSEQTIPGSSITHVIVDAGNDFETAIGDSIAVNGCCLTVTSNKMRMLSFDVSSETLACTSLGELSNGQEVNLERALRLGDRLGGHLVSGHVDGTGEILAIGKQPDGWQLSVILPRALGRYMIPKGSVCLDGVSLTINQVDDTDEAAPGQTVIHLMLIPTTVTLTTFKHLSPGQRINVEVDMMAKYVERLNKH